ncbi:Protein glass [Gryllus bimaculatus]|nr:Protein glass [Gryllus bimaculatus]
MVQSNYEITLKVKYKLSGLVDDCNLQLEIHVSKVIAKCAIESTISLDPTQRDFLWTFKGAYGVEIRNNVLSASYDGGSAALGHLVMTIWRCREWLSHSERLDLRSPMDVYKSFRLCGAQFNPSQFMSQDKRKLIHNAVPSTIFSCTNPCSGLPELAPGPHPPPVDCRKMTEEAAGKGEPVWMQSHVAHAASVSSAVSAPPAHLPAAPCAPAADPAMSLFPRQMQLGAQPITELKLFMHPKPTMHPHLSQGTVSSGLQFSYIFQERPPAKPPGKGDPAQVFWVKPDQNNPQQAALPGVKDKMNEKEMNSNENHEGDSSSLPGMSTPSRPPRPHSAERQYKCKDCGKAFPQPSHLIRHTRTHTGEQPYKCDLCGRAFSDQSHRLRHLRTHIGVRTHKCEECGKEFFEPNHLVRHARRHTGERPYPCDQCGKAFCEQSGLNRHLRTHSGERPFKCELCGRAFPQRSELARHRRTHSGSSGSGVSGSSAGDPSSPAESTSSAGQPSTSGETRIMPIKVRKMDQDRTEEWGCSLAEAAPWPYGLAVLQGCKTLVLLWHLKIELERFALFLKQQPEETSQLQKPTEPAWMQGPVAHPTPGLSCPPPHFLAPLVAGPDPSMPFFPSQMQLGSQPLAEVKLVMTPKPSMHPHLSQGRDPTKGHSGKPDPAHLFWVKPTEQDTARAQAAAAAAAAHQAQQNHTQNTQPQQQQQQQQQQNHQGAPAQNHHSPQNHQSSTAPGHPPSQVSPSKSKASGKTHHSCSSKSSDGISPWVSPQGCNM